MACFLRHITWGGKHEQSSSGRHFQLEDEANGMKRNHLTQPEFEGYKRQKLSAKELLSVDDHCRECEECRKQLFLNSELVGASMWLGVRDAGRMEHLSFEQLQSYADLTANEIDREIIEAHLELCLECFAEQKDLQLFKADLETNLHEPGKEGKLLLFGGGVSGAALRIAGIAAALVLLVFAATLPFRNRIAHLESDLHQTTLQKEQAEHRLQEFQGGSHTSVVASFQDGGTSFVLTKDLQLNGGESLPAPYRQLVRETLVNKRLQAPPFLSEIIPKGGVLMGQANGVPFSLIHPVGVVVVADRPEFHWDIVPGARGYEVGISDTKFNEVESSTLLNDTTWTPSRPLKRGEIYVWQVTALRGNTEIRSPVPPAPEARFKVLEADQMKELNETSRTYSNFHMLMGILYSKLGVLDQAESEFKELLKANPDSAEARGLLNSVEALRKPGQEPAPTTTKGAQ